MFPTNMTSFNAKNDPHEVFDESVSDFQGETIFREPKRIKLKAEVRSSLRTKAISSDNCMDESTEELLQLESVACDENEKLCLTCKTIISKTDYSSHLRDCLRKFKHSTKSARTPPKISNITKKDDHVVLPCPVCSKVLSSSSQRISHLKKCGSEHGISSDKILVAVRLQERQADERASLGLPRTIAAVRNLNGKKRKRENHSSAEMELASVLSLSMVNKQENDLMKEEDNLIEIGLPSVVLEKRRKRAALQDSEDMQVRITNNKTKRKSKKQKKVSSILASRTKEDRESILSEKLAEILLNEDCHTRQPTKPLKHSNALSALISKGCATWDMSLMGGKDLGIYYVPELSKYIEPKFVEVGGLFKHFSQIPGRLTFTQIGKAFEEDCNSDDESRYSDDPEKTIADLYSTQLALADLLGSQEFSMSPTLNRIECTSHFKESSGTVVSNVPETIVSSDSVVSKLPEVFSSGAMVSQLTKVSPLTSVISYEKLMHTCSGMSALPKVISNSYVIEKLSPVSDTKGFVLNQVEILSDVTNQSKSRLLCCHCTLSCTSEHNIYKSKLELDKTKLKSASVDTKNIDVSSDKLTTGRPLSDMHSKFIYDWSKLLRNSNNSDVRIDTANGTIPVHSLVLRVRCYSLSEEALSNNNSINWTSIQHEIAFLFMVYLYTGQYAAICDNVRCIELLQLAVKYDCHDLEILLQNDKCSVIKDDKRLSNIDNSLQFTYNSIPNSPDIFGDSFDNVKTPVEHSSKIDTVEKGLSEDNIIKDKDNEEEITFLSSYTHTSSLSNRSNISVDNNDKNSTRRRLYDDSGKRVRAADSSIMLKPQYSAVVDLTSNDSNSNESHEAVASKEISFSDQIKNSILSETKTEAYPVEGTSFSVDNDIFSNTLKTTVNEQPSSVGGEAERFIKDNLPFTKTSPGNVPLTNDVRYGNDYVTNVWDDFDDVGIYEYRDITPLKSTSGTFIPLNNILIHNSPEKTRRISHSPNACEAGGSKKINISVEDDIGDATLLQAVIQSEKCIDLEHSSTIREPRFVVDKKTFVTPKNLSRKDQTVTPMLPYKTMVTPELQKALDKYGIRKLSRNKAIKLLVHIYEEMHPLVTDSEASFCDTPVDNCIKNVNQKKSATRERSESINSSQSSLASSCSTDANKDFETSLFGIDDDEDDDLSLTQKRSMKDQIYTFIKSDEVLYRKILMYEPIWINVLKKSLKDCGIKCSSKKLIDYLDEQCITFRYNKNGSNGRQRRGKKKNK